MKKFLIATTMLCAVSGLAVAQNSETFTHPSWMWEEGDVGVWHRARMEEFEAASGLDVEATLIPSSAFEGTITTQMAAGDVPDLLPVFTNMLAPLMDADLLAPLDDCIAGSSYADRILPSVNFAQRDGMTYGVPLTMSPQSMLYNRRLLDAAGVEVPTNLDEFYEAARAVHETTGEWGYGFNNDTANVLHTYINSMQWLIGLGGDWSQPDGEITANSPEAVEAIGWVSRFLDEGLSPRGLDSTAVRTLFAEGKVGFLFDGPWVMTQVQSANPDLLPDIGYAVMPTPTHAAITGGAFYVIPADADHPEAACDYLEIINAEDAQRAWLEGLLQIPGTSVEPSAAFLEQNPWVETMVEVAANYPGGLGYAPPGYGVDAAEFRQIVVDHLAQVYAGSATVEDALNDLQAELEDWADSL